LGYAHIDNLYKAQTILLFRKCYAMEKIHGSSAALHWRDGELTYHAGGASDGAFRSLFDHEKLVAILKEKFSKRDRASVYGEVYGGKMQGMSKTYGPSLGFIVFEAKIHGNWLSVPKAEVFAHELCLEFVEYEKINCTMEEIDRCRDKPSELAIRRGMGDNHTREGVVLKPLVELTKNNGDRIIAKHKRDEFRETATPRKVMDPAQLQILSEAQAVADEWVTDMRLQHVLGRFPDAGMNDMGNIIRAVVEDVKREGDKEIGWSPTVGKAISKKAARLLVLYFKTEEAKLIEEMLS
jgi:hypothetical protein